MTTSLNNDDFTVLVSGGSRRSLSEHVCCGAITFKMTEWVEQWTCITFWVRPERSSAETIRLIRKAAAMGNWWLAASSHQHAHSCIMFHAEFFGEASNHPDDSAPLQSKFGALWLLAFPKAKIAFEREEISDCQWDSGKFNWAANSDWENCVRSQGAYCEEDWGVIVLCTVFLVSYIFFNKCLFHSTWLDTFWTNLVYKKQRACYDRWYILGVRWCDVREVMREKCCSVRILTWFR